jgi:hypothetical protein
MQYVCQVPKNNVLFPLAREYLMISRGPGFLAVVGFGSFPNPSLFLNHQKVVSLSQSSCVSLAELTDRRGGRGWGRSQSIRRRESLILYYSILSATCPLATSNQNKASSFKNFF